MAAMRITIMTTKAATREIADIFLLERVRSKLKSKASVFGVRYKRIDQFSMR
jgi:hypothetical protein